MLGPDSALGPLIAAAILPLVGADGDPSKAVALAGMLALLMGALCVAAGLARLGVLAELLSKPVRIGFLNGIAVVVLVSQLPQLFGFDGHATGFFDECEAFARGVIDGEVVAAAATLGIGSLVLILVFRRWSPKVPGILIAVVCATAVTSALDLAAHGVEVVGPIPAGFPTPTFPDVTLHEIGSLLIAAAAMAFVTLADTTTVSRSFATQRGERVDANREIVALGAANAAAAFFHGFPVSASASRTAVASSAGSRTKLAGVVGAAVILVVLLADGGLGRNLPKSTLAAIVIAAVFLLFDFTSMRWFWAVRRSELYLSFAALLGVAVLGVLEGLGVAIALSLGDFIRRAWRPHDAVLGRVRGRKGYHDVERHPEALQIPGLVLYRFDAPLFFANAELFADHLEAMLSARTDTPRWVIIAAEPISDIDTSAADILKRLFDDLDTRGIEVAFAELKGPVKDRLRSYGLYDRVGDDRFYPTIGTAVSGYVVATGTQWVDWSDDAKGSTDPEP